MTRFLSIAFSCLFFSIYSLPAQWIDITPPGMASATGDLDFWDANHGMVASSNGVYWTTDGGMTWQSQTSCVGRQVDYASATTMATASTGGICLSTDAGQTWNSVNLPYTPNSSTFIEQIDFISDSVAAILYSYSQDYYWAITQDQGQSWTPYLLPEDLSSGCTLSSYNREKMLLLGPQEGLYLAADSIVYQTSNGGQSWQQILTGPSVTRIDRKNDSLIFLSNKLYSTNNGQSWNPVPGANPINSCALGIDWGMFSPTQYTWATVIGPTPTTYSGEIKLTIDGGASWSLLPNSFGFGAPDQMHFIDGQTLYTQWIYTGNASDLNQVKKWTGPLLGQEPVKTAKWLVYPNPTSDFLNLRFSEWEGKLTVKLWDMQGNLILEKVSWALPGEEFQLSVQEIPAGFYGFEIIQKERRFFQKVRVN